MHGTCTKFYTKWGWSFALELTVEITADGSEVDWYIVEIRRNGEYPKEDSILFTELRESLEADKVFQCWLDDAFCDIVADLREDSPDWDEGETERDDIAEAKENQ